MQTFLLTPPNCLSALNQRTVLAINFQTPLPPGDQRMTDSWESSEMTVAATIVRRNHLISFFKKVEEEAAVLVGEKSLIETEIPPRTRENG